MAWITKDNIIFIANYGKPIHSIVEKVAFRRYWGKKYDKKTKQYVRAMKSMPYAICKVRMSSDPSIKIGAEFTIAGYKLRNVVMKGEKILTFHDQYVAEFADEYGNEWVRKLILEEKQKEKKDEDR